MFQKIAKHRANDASNDVHRPPLVVMVVVETEVVSPGFFRSGDRCHFEVVRVVMRTTIEIGLLTSFGRIRGLCLR